MIHSYCYKSVQRFRVTCLFTGQYDTGKYGTIAGVTERLKGEGLVKLRPDKYNTMTLPKWLSAMPSWDGSDVLVLRCYSKVVGGNALR